MKKICPLILLIWPYLFLPFVWLDSLQSGDGMLWVIIYCLLTPVVYIANIICACSTKNASSLAFWDMLLKLFHIPSYVIIFLLGVMLTGQLVVGLPFGLILVPILVVIDCALLVTTSLYGVNALARARSQRAVSIPFLIVNLILHFIFVLDVISSIVVFCKVRKRKLSA